MNFALLIIFSKVNLFLVINPEEQQISLSIPIIYIYSENINKSLNTV